MKMLVRNILKPLISEDKRLQLSVKLNYPFVSPTVLSIDTTSKCNSRCIYCIWWKEKSEKETPPTLDDIAALCASSVKLGVERVSLSGGEPLLRNDIEQIISILSKEFSVTLITNGMLLSQKKLDALINAGLSTIVLSYDSFHPETYKKIRGVDHSFPEKALKVIENSMEKSNLIFSVNCVVTRYNIDHLEEHARRVLDRFKKSASVNFQAYDIKYGKTQDILPSKEMFPLLTEQIDKLIKLKQQGYLILNSNEYLRNIPDYLMGSNSNSRCKCASGFKTVSIDSEMNLHPCYSLPAIADLRKETLENMWYSARMKEQRHQMITGNCPGCTSLINKTKSLNYSLLKKK